MENLDILYASAILLSFGFVCHFVIQSGVSTWFIYFIFARMWPFMKTHQPWDPLQEKIDAVIDGTVLGNLQSICGVAGDIFARKGRGGSWSSSSGGGGSKGAPKGTRIHGLCPEDGWKGDLLGISIAAGFYLVGCVLLSLWAAFVFKRVLNLARQQRPTAFRVIVRLMFNELVVPALAALVGLAWYLVYNSWTWFTQCRPLGDRCEPPKLHQRPRVDRAGGVHKPLIPGRRWVHGSPRLDARAGARYTAVRRRPSGWGSS
jgi:hypothetical protein